MTSLPLVPVTLNSQQRTSELTWTWPSLRPRGGREGANQIKSDKAMQSKTTTRGKIQPCMPKAITCWPTADLSVYNFDYCHCFVYTVRQLLINWPLSRGYFGSDGMNFSGHCHSGEVDVLRGSMRENV